ncbi:MAG: transposase [Bacteroidales bacterium]|nr:transposase [Bacteroidales bacterium]
MRYREYVYFRIYENRGDCGKGILEDYTGTIIHDHWISYYKFKKCRHAECNVHTNRVLNGLAILDKIELAFEFKKFMSSIDHERNDLIKNGIYSFSTERIKEIEDKYTESLINLGSYFEGLSENERKIYYKDGVNLVKRMLKYKENHLLFLHDFNVPFGNNDAERPLRHFKLKKQSMGSARSIIGSNNLITNMTAIKTEYFKTSNLLDFILESFIGKKIEVCTKEKTNSCDMAE